MGSKQLAHTAVLYVLLIPTNHDGVGVGGWDGDVGVGGGAVIWCDDAYYLGAAVVGEERVGLLAAQQRGGRGRRRAWRRGL